MRLVGLFISVRLVVMAVAAAERFVADLRLVAAVAAAVAFDELPCIYDGTTREF